MDWIATLQALIKPLVILAYAALGIFLLSAAAGRRIRFIAIPSLPVKVLLGLVTGLIWVWFMLHGYPFIVSVALGIVVFAFKDGAWRSRGLTLGGIAVVILSVSLAWWLGDGPQPPGYWRPVVFGIVVWCVQAGLTREAERPDRNWLPIIFLAFGVAGFALQANMAQYEPGSNALALLVHHQGAYIGPALHVKAGLVPFYDIPLQYGLGPTLSIAAVCGASNCWSGMAFLMVSSTLAMGLLILSMGLSTRVARGTIERVTAALVIFAAVFLWPGFIFLGSIPAASPSVGGLRFLPVTLIAFLLFFGRTRLAAAVLVPAVLWSPETAVMSLVVFGVHETARLGFLNAAIRSIAITGGTVAGFALVHHIIYGVWIQPDVVAEYILHVPGPLPINPISDFVVLAGTLGLGAWNVYRQPSDRLAFRQDLVITSLLFASTSYYLGRSHPNNICNLMPFIVLVALRSLDGKAPSTLPGMPRLAILGISAVTAALMLSPWYYPPFQHGFSVDTERLAAAAARLDSDMIDIRSRIANPEHLGVADLGHLNRNPAETTLWTPMDPASVWTYVPSQRRQLYIKRSATRLHLSGWVILGDNQRDWLNDFRVAYQITEEKEYKIQSAMSNQPQTYLVAHLTPIEEVGRR